ncbi:Syntaxin-8 [Tyrophagus putrescentiae]|nr:Syntaxin-8 [Tyrophagus putrescentiae]
MDDWINDHDNIDEFANELMHKLNQRNQYPMNTQPFAKSDLHIKDLFRKFTQKVAHLQENLNASANRITQREAERRQRLVDNLSSRCKQIENLINNPDSDRRLKCPVSATATTRALVELTASTTTTPMRPPLAGTLAWRRKRAPAATTTGNSNQSVTTLRETQRLLLQAQDEGLDTLGNIITRQKYLAQGINTEIDLHNEILEDIGEAITDTDDRVTRNTRNIQVVSNKASTCGM